MTTAASQAASGPVVFGVPLVFALFALTLVGVLAFHRRALEVALMGLGVILAVRLTDPSFDLSHHLGREWVGVLNLLGLLVGFAQLASHFERSHLPAALLEVLPKGRFGCFTLLLLVWLLSGVVDNIAAAMIGATAATRIFKSRLHLGYVTAIVACANAGGAGSVLGDTTTTMMWLEGVSPLRVLPAYTGALVVLLVCGTLASIQQARHAPAETEAPEEVRIDLPRVAIVVLALAAVVVWNIVARATLGPRSEAAPFMAAVLWTVLLLAVPVRALNWSILPGSLKSAAFLLSLVLAASLMPVHALPKPTTSTTLGVGLVSSVFDNIPLTKLALDQGGYDWALLAYSVGVGGSMLWFGSSAGVAVSSMFPSARSAWRWLVNGWHVPVGFLLGFFVQRVLQGWQP